MNNFVCSLSLKNTLLPPHEVKLYPLNLCNLNYVSEWFTFRLFAIRNFYVIDHSFLDPLECRFRNG